jgi:hypothetical protein
MRTHTTIYVSSHYYICVLILLHPRQEGSGTRCICVRILLYMCPHTTIYVSSFYYICVLILLYMCPHTTIYASSYCYIRAPGAVVASAVYVSAYYYICVLILLYMWPHTTIYLSSYYICGLILLYPRGRSGCGIRSWRVSRSYARLLAR